MTVSSCRFVRVAACSAWCRPGDVEGNFSRIVSLYKDISGQGTELAVFPELSLSGYTCADLFFQELLLDECERASEALIQLTEKLDGVLVWGAPWRKDGVLYNCGLAAGKGHLLGIVPKSFIPNSGEFYEKRWFASGRGETGSVEFQGESVPWGTDLVFKSNAFSFGIELCEDLWSPEPPSTGLALAGADIIVNLSASNELVGKADYRRELVAMQSGRSLSAYVYASAGVGESSTDTVFGGHCLVAENARILGETERFSRQEQILIRDLDVDFLRHERIKSTTFGDAALDYRGRYRAVDFPGINVVPRDELMRFVDKHPFVPFNKSRRRERCREIFSIQSHGLATRLGRIGCKKAVIGLSGGLDSTHALLVTVQAFEILGLDPAGILCFTMPGFGTTARTKNNATELCESLGLPIETVNINEVCSLQLVQIEHHGEPSDTAYENVQARQRTMFLMNKANLEGGIVIGTGDLSELAIGWCTYNGDHMSMYAVNTGVPKTLIRYLVEFVASESDEKTAAVLNDIVDTPISPELLPPDRQGEIAQKTEDLIGPYELHDFFLYHAVRCGASPRKVYLLVCEAFKGEYSEEALLKWLCVFTRRFFSQQFKRSCLPDGPKVGTIALSPRGDWRMPSDASAALWLKELEEIIALG